MSGASDGELLSKPSDEDPPTLKRTPSTYSPLRTFDLAKGEQKHYQQQYADMYFARLAQLKPAVEQIAAEAWEDFEIGGEGARRVERVLDVRQGELCWVVGTIYMEMPLKPNILDDLSKEHWITAPPPRIKYLNPDGKDQVMLEDESGRLRLTGKFLQTCLLVTGCIIAVVGTENADGDFEALDVKVPDLARQPQRWEKDDGDAAVSGKSLVQEKLKAGKVAVLSGLEIDTDAGDAFALDLLLEYLLGESSSPAEQEEHSRISRLIIAGNSLAGASPIPSREEYASFRKNGQKRTYGYDQTSYDSGPTARLDTLLTTLLPSMPITMLPGDSDPTQASLPQQPIHPAMFPESRSFMAVPGSGETGWLDSVTNPWEGDIDGWRFMGNGGQPVDDIYKYVDGEERLEMIEAMLRWRLGAPTAPDTLWCYPYQDADAFVMTSCPHVFFVGNQPKFETRIIMGPLGQAVRLVAVPKFRETGQLVILDMETLDAELVKFNIFRESG